MILRASLPIILAAFCLPVVLAAEPFRIEVVDKDNGWPVPLVELTTTSDSQFVTDNAGVAAFDLDEFMGVETWLHVFSHGYELPADGFGNRGVRFTPEPGGRLTIEIERKQIAKRLGRLTGSGLFAESQKFGEHGAWEESGITGCDTVQLTRHGDRLFWLWGDTDLPGYPLGIFHTSGATTGLDPLISTKPPTAIRYDYFRNKEGKPRGVAVMPGDGPTWVSGFTSLPDNRGRLHMVATYAKIRNMLEPYEFGLIEWNEQKEEFESVLKFWEKKGDEKGPPRPYPDGHPLFWSDAEGKKWLYFNGPPNFRCPATYEAWKDRSTWEEVKNPKIFDTIGGGRVEVASASVEWNEYRQRWVMILQQKFGDTSPFGEVWYLEGASPAGPWGPAIKVATHQNYTFYNVQIDSHLADPDDPFLLFEGTYVTTFTDNQNKTPRYDYNQVLYRLDLDDPALEKARLMK